MYIWGTMIQWNELQYKSEVAFFGCFFVFFVFLNNVTFYRICFKISILWF